MKKLSLPSISIALLFACHGTAQAGTVTGNIGATITLEKACVLNGDSNASNLDMGDLDFGTHSALFENADATLTSNSGSALVVECSNGANGTLTLGNGLHDTNAGTYQHAMKYNSSYVPYNLIAKVNDLPIDVTAAYSIPIGAGPVNLEISAIAYGKLNLEPGTYTDTISVTFAF